MKVHLAVMFDDPADQDVEQLRDAALVLERFFHFLDSKREHGLLVMDEADKTEDRRFVGRLQRYFTKTQWPVSDHLDCAHAVFRGLRHDLPRAGG